MGTFDQLLPSSDRYISTYQGQPIEEVRELGQVLNQNYMRGLENASHLGLLEQNYGVLDQDQAMKEEAFSGVKSYLQDLARAGNYEGAIPKISMLAGEIAGNKQLQQARSNQAAYNKWATDLDKRVQTGKIEEWQAQAARKRARSYKGVAKNDSITPHLYNPVNSQDIDDEVMKALRAVKPQSREEMHFDPHLGKYVISTIDGTDRSELESVAANVIATNPEAQAYYREMVDAYGPEQAQLMITEKLGAFVDGAHYQNISTSRVIEGLPGIGSGRTLLDRGYGTKENLPIQEDRGMGYIEVKEKLPLPEIGEPGFFGKLLGHASAKLGNFFAPALREMPVQQRMETFNTLKENAKTDWERMKVSVMETFFGSPTEEEYENYQKVARGARESAGLTQHQWNAMSGDKQDKMVMEYFDQLPDRQTHIGQLRFDQDEEVGIGHLSKTGDKEFQDQDNITKSMLPDIRGGSANVFSFEEEKNIKIEDDKFLRRAVNEGDVKIVSRVDPKHVYAKNDPELANAYVLQAYDGDEVKNYLVPVGKKANRSPVSQVRAAQNKIIANIFNTFELPGIEERLEFGDVTISGSRARNPMNPQQEMIALSSIEIGGQPITPEQAQGILGGSNAVAGPDGRIYVTEEALAAALFSAK